MSDLQKVGPDYGGSGTFKPFTADTTGAQRVQDAHARYFEAVRSGNVYALSARNLTLAAGQGYAQAAARPSTSCSGIRLPATRCWC
jgi:glucan biosynthesis protein